MVSKETSNLLPYHHFIFVHFTKSRQNLPGPRSFILSRPARRGGGGAAAAEVPAPRRRRPRCAPRRPVLGAAAAAAGAAAARAAGAAGAAPTAWPGPPAPRAKRRSPRREAEGPRRTAGGDPAGGENTIGKETIRRLSVLIPYKEDFSNL